MGPAALACTRVLVCSVVLIQYGVCHSPHGSALCGPIPRPTLCRPQLRPGSAGVASCLLRKPWPRELISAAVQEVLRLPRHSSSTLAATGCCARTPRHPGFQPPRGITGFQPPASFIKGRDLHLRGFPPFFQSFHAIYPTLSASTYTIRLHSPADRPARHLPCECLTLASCVALSTASG